MTNYEMFEMSARSFITDWEKMRDFFHMTKKDFLQSYSYLTKEEYDATKNYWNWLISEEKGDKLWEISSTK